MRGTITLPSGRVFEPEGTIVGLDIANLSSVYSGYDHREWEAEARPISTKDTVWPKEDRVALANIMIELWAQYKAQVEAT